MKPVYTRIRFILESEKFKTNLGTKCNVQNDAM